MDTAGYVLPRTTIIFGERSVCYFTSATWYTSCHCL